MNKCWQIEMSMIVDETSTPNKPKGFKECYIDLSPKSKDVLSNLIHDSEW